MRPLDAVIARLEAQALGVAGATIFAGSDVDLPSRAGAFLTLVETGGRSPIASHNAGTLRQPSLQVTARADLYVDAAALADLAYLALGGGDQPIVNRWFGDLFVLWMRPLQEPFPLPMDVLGRVRLAFNVDLLVRRPDVTRGPWIAPGWVAPQWVAA